jgi:hypothetical protein
LRLLIVGLVALFSSCGSAPVPPVVQNAQSVTVRIQHQNATELEPILREVLEHRTIACSRQGCHYLPSPVTVGLDADNNSITLRGFAADVGEVLDLVARLDVEEESQPEGGSRR